NQGLQAGTGKIGKFKGEKSIESQTGSFAINFNLGHRDKASKLRGLDKPTAEVPNIIRLTI
ncbi:MAG TPA: hypothetical protein VFD18_02505, partial [Chthoniobacterales bacterium]|nr:hypothetical protein [Chthoniobacterales bacterium]